MNDNHCPLSLEDELIEGPYTGYLLEDVIDEYPEYIRELLEEGELAINKEALDYFNQD